jgi:hypothetical protein
MRLHFNAALVQQLLQHSGAATSRKAPDGTCSSAHEAGLWMVGDHGIYLMSNGVPGLLAGDGPGSVIAYAEEADPDLQPETFYSNKRKALGGDDSITFLPEAWVTGLLARSRDGRVCIDLTRKGARIASPAPTRRRAGQAVNAAAPVRQEMRPGDDAAAFMRELLAVLDRSPPEDREAQRRRRAIIRMTHYSVLLAEDVPDDAAKAALGELSKALGYTIAAPRSSFRLRQDAWALVSYLSALRGDASCAAEMSDIAAKLAETRTRLWSRSNTSKNLALAAPN